MPTKVSSLRGGGRSYSRTFVQSDLDNNNMLLVLHNLNGYIASVLVTDQDGLIINVATRVIDTNSLVLSISNPASLPGINRITVGI